MVAGNIFDPQKGWRAQPENSTTPAIVSPQITYLRTDDWWLSVRSAENQLKKRKWSREHFGPAYAAEMSNGSFTRLPFSSACSTT